MRTLMSALAVLALTAAGCKDRSDSDAPPSAQKQVEQVNEQSAAAYERAKEAQERAADEAEEAARAQDKVAKERADLREAETKAAQSAAEAQAAQDQARSESEAAHAEAQSLSARAAELQTRANQEVRVRTESVEMIDPETNEPIVTPDINDDTAANEALMQAEIDAVFDEQFGVRPSRHSQSSDLYDRLNVRHTE